MPSNKAIVFIDGNNLYHCLKDMGLKLPLESYPTLCVTICEKFGLNWEKTCYYNSVPTPKPGKEGIGYWKHIDFLKALGNLPKFEVKTRKLQRRSNYEIQQKKLRFLKTLKLCKACRPMVEQNCLDCVGDFSDKEKGIDVLLAVEMIEKALKKECDYCVLVSGDADFIPVLKLIVANKRKIKSVSVPKGYATEIKTTFPKDYFMLNEEEFEKIGIEKRLFF